MTNITKMIAIVGIIGVVAFVGVIGAAVATGSMSVPLMGSGNHMGNMMDENGNMSPEMGAQCQNGGMQNMMNGQDHMGMMNGSGQCQNVQDMHANMTKNADGTWKCPGYQNDQALA